MVKTKLIIDTGSPFSLINYPTFSRLNLPKGKIVVKDMIIADTSINLFSIPNLRLYMKSEEEKVVSIITSIIAVAVPSEWKRTNRKYMDYQIYGLDFLGFHTFKLFADVKNKIVT